MRKLSAGISHPVSTVNERVVRGLDAGNEESGERTTAMTTVRSLTTGWVASSRTARDIEPVAVLRSFGTGLNIASKRSVHAGRVRSLQEMQLRNLAADSIRGIGLSPASPTPYGDCHSLSARADRTW